MRVAAPLRVALVVASVVVPAYVDEVIEQIKASPSCVVVAVVMTSPRRRTRRDRGNHLFRLYERLDRRTFSSEDDAFAPVRIDARRDGAATPPIELSLEAGKLRQLDLDVVVDLRERSDAALPADVARFGVWRLRPGLPGPAALFPELAAGSLITSQSLDAAIDGHSDLVTVSRTVTPIVPYSLDRTRQMAFWKSANLVVRGLERLRDGGAWPANEDGAHGTGERPAVEVRGRGARQMPGYVETTVFGARMALRAGGMIAHKALRTHEWFVAWRPARSASPPADLSGFRPIPAGPDHFYADPFLLEVDGHHHLFVEDYAFSEGRAAISTLELHPDGSVGPTTVVLKRPYHLSYPFVFRDGDAFYMLPETKGSQRIELYRATQFPTSWELAAVLTDFPAADPTILRHGGRYWLFVTRTLRGTNPWDELFLYHADRLEGPWQPHPRNPIVSDARSARPAGRILDRDGVLLRPAQDCSHAYGWRIRWNRIEVLTETDYREVPLDTTEPKGIPGVERTHTYDNDGTFEVLDGLRSRFRIGRPS